MNIDLSADYCNIYIMFANVTRNTYVIIACACVCVVSR